MKVFLSGVEWVIRLGIGSVFFYAGIIKVFNPNDFAVVIAGYGLLPELMIFPVAVALPILELIAAVGLIFRARGSLTALFVMLVGFIAVLSYGILLGLDVDCGCFSSTDPEAAYKGLKHALYRDLLLLVGMSYLFLHEFRWPVKAGIYR